MIRRLNSVLPPFSIVRDSAYQQDEGQPSSLLEETCAEKFGRLRTLRLLNAYLATAPGGRRRQVVVEEEKALRGLYEAVWVVLEFAFPAAIVLSARHCVETLLSEDCHGCAQIQLF